MSSNWIHVKGARTHNLKDIDLKIPRDQLVVITGLSGSGKSSLAFDTIYAEGQRRYVESLSAYARQFLDQMEKPEVDTIEGLSPAISIEQKTTSKNPRSTVATVTEIYDYYRLLFARIGKPHCPKCGNPIVSQSATEIIDTIMRYPQGTAIMILAPVVKDRKGEFRKLFQELLAKGYTRALVDGEMIRIEEAPQLDKNYKHRIDAVIDRIKVDTGKRDRIADSVEHALHLGEGVIKLDFPREDRDPVLLSEHLVCLSCQISFPLLEPRNFSFNSPHGACQQCDGLGETREFDPDRILDWTKSIQNGAILPYGGREGGWYLSKVLQIAEKYRIPTNKPFHKLTEKQKNIILNGVPGKTRFVFRKDEKRYEFNSEYKGVIATLKRKYRETTSTAVREQLETFMSLNQCQGCSGKRLKPLPLSVLVQGRNIAFFSELSVRKALKTFSEMKLEGNDAQIAEKILKEVISRLSFLNGVGLGYLTLNRTAGTLSGGESQRIRLATQLGSRLMGVLYVLDEPSIGLHQRDNQRLLNTLKDMRDLGNTVIVVEHDEDTIREADYLIDLGPGAGEHGGEVVFSGKPEKVEAIENSLTGQFLSGKAFIEVPARRRRFNKRKMIHVSGCKQNNLKHIDAVFPTGVFTCVTGVSGSGKSTLVTEILYKAAHNHVYGTHKKTGSFEKIKGLNHIDKVIEIDQSPIGRTPRSNPATYVGLFTPIRELFSQVPESRARGYKPGRFSFNVKGGRCETCQGAGLIKIEMHFLPDIFVTCEQCGGKRYNRETLEILYRGKNIHQVLNMTVEESLEFFTHVPQVRRRCQTLYDVGLSYVRLGQAATTLSGGEAQRVKLSKELSKKDTGQTLYILDEPTTGLHFADVKKLLAVLHRLVDQNNTLIMIEHNLDVIKSADYVIDLGPEGGSGGGTIIATGTPEAICQVETSFTGQFLKGHLTHRD
ncbi:MAG: excinuclease ABC subunit A [Acidobacteria bacterium]|nr:MAG: excinuclease ABC subunit A [Acidobacteriota bacterium]